MSLFLLDLQLLYALAYMKHASITLSYQISTLKIIIAVHIVSFSLIVFVILLIQNLKYIFCADLRCSLKYRPT